MKKTPIIVNGKEVPQKEYVIAVDFDGTCVSHEYPDIGDDVGAVPVLKKIVDNGHKLVLNTMRHGKDLDEAVNWFHENGVELWGVNTNPTQRQWTSSPKVYANIYIDDAALGCPLKTWKKEGIYVVNWNIVENFLEGLGVI